MRRSILVIAGLVFLQWIAGAGMVLAQPPGQGGLSPSQAAFLKAENRRIEDHFVARVASITATSPDRVRQAMPDERRITVTVERLISALERDLGGPLSAEQRSAIVEADEYRRQSLARIREGAALR